MTRRHLPRDQALRLSVFLLSVFLLSFVACSSGANTVLDGDVDVVAGDVADQDGADEVDPADTEGEGTSGCKPGSTGCASATSVQVCNDQGEWREFACGDGEFCVQGECREALCSPNALRCADDGSVEICRPDGSGWEAFRSCDDDQVCNGGACVDRFCEPGTTACAGTTVLTCGEDGASWEESPCADDSVCFDGACLECVYAEHCDDGLVCVAGACDLPALAILTQILPPGTTGQDYLYPLEASGGDGAYTWTLIEGALPAGLFLSTDGVLNGAPTETGDFPIDVEVADGLGEIADGSFTLTVIGLGETLVITTGSPLPKATEGEPYHVALSAEGGETPYGWFINAGSLPAGVQLLSSGELQGIPTEIGTFTFTVKVVDNAIPVGFAAKEFELSIKVAPLNIVAAQIFDVWVAKIVILPMLTVIPGIPLPYDQQLEAKGGLKPYHWSEVEIPGVQWLLPKAGVPVGLTLEEDGRLHGSVTDPDEVMELAIPFTQIGLTGFFFGGQVIDSNDPTDSDTGLFLIPTLPVAF